ncbi:MAG: sigma-54 dependent transcriptional regulator, partial [Nitrospirota bacterium]
MAKILVIDDDANLCWTLSKVLSEEHFEIKTAATGPDGLKILRDEGIDLLILDLALPGMGGISVLEELRSFDHHLPVLILTGYGNIHTAVQTTKLGAFNYLCKPFKNEELIREVRNALALRQTFQPSEDEGNQEFEQEVKEVMGWSSVVSGIMAQVKMVAPTDLTVLLQGETGCGKELAAEFIHRYSKRKDSPFVVIDCGSIPETLAESEYFGHEKGAFTGAIEHKQGRLEMAEGGTVFLDEVGNVPLLSQGKLLRVLEEKEIQHLGGRKLKKLDIRIIAATNISLLDAVKAKKFREDLYHRLNGVSIHIPPLRERREDLCFLANLFLREANLENKKEAKGFSPSVMSIFLNYSWPGNVRELKQVIKRAAVFAEDLILPQHLPPVFTSTNTEDGAVAIPDGESIPNLRAISQMAAELAEKALIHRILRKHKG